MTNRSDGVIIKPSKKEVNLLNIKGRGLTPVDTVKETTIQYVSGMADGSSRREALTSIKR